MAVGNPQILIVDDDEFILNSLKKILKKNGYSVDLATSAKQALELCSINFYECLILDCLLPDKSGLALARDMRLQQDHLPHIIFMSGVYGDPGFVSSCLKEAGGSRFYTKPFNALDLVNYLNEILKGKVATPQIVERFFTLPNPSAEDLFEGSKGRQRVIGYELPLIISQFAKLKVSKNVDIYQGSEICCQLRFQRGSLVQCYLFVEETAGSMKVDLENLNVLVNSQKFELHFYNAGSTTVNSIFEENEIIKWAEMRTFTHLPIYWIVSRIFPILGGKIYSKLNRIEEKPMFCWPLLRPEKFTLSKVLHRTPLNTLLDLGSLKEEYIRCLYNYFLNGSVWVDNLKPKYEEEALDQFFSWHYNLIAKQNYFDILEVSRNLEEGFSETAKIYFYWFERINEAIKSKKIEEWIGLESAVLQAAIKKIDDPIGRQRYAENVRKSELAESLAIKNVYLEVFDAFEQGNYKMVSDRLRGVQTWSRAPGELKLIKVWSELKECRSESQVKELEVDLLKISCNKRFSYLLRLNQGLIQKCKGNYPVARRLFLESQKLNPVSKVARSEVEALRPTSPSAVLWIQQKIKDFRFKRMTSTTG